MMMATPGLFGRGVVMMVVMVIVMANQDQEDLLPSDVPLTVMERLSSGKSGADKEEVEHRTPLGTLTGRKEPTSGTPPLKNSHLYAFRGIPYAEAPLGAMRWEDPVDLMGPWPGGHLDATENSPFCPQYDYESKRVLGSENCLFLNVFTPYLPGSTDDRAKHDQSLLPVFVFFHGGGYLRASSATHGPAYLLAHDLVLVTLNYRLGALGFLNTGDETVPGNYGVLDQVSALRWVQRNVEHFGGDPAQVTIGGFSAGAISVNLHMVSPLSKGLFHRSIMMSSSASCDWTVKVNEVGRHYAHDLARRLACPESPSAALKSCLTSISINDLLTAQAAMHAYVFWPLPFFPVVDAGQRDKPLLPDAVDQLTPSNVPVLVGITKDEGVLFGATMMMMAETNNATALYRAHISTLFKVFAPSVQETIQDFTVPYYYTRHAKHNLDILMEQSSELITDLISYCTWSAAEAFLSAGLPVYTYVYSHRGPDTPTWAKPIYQRLEQLGYTSHTIVDAVSHGDDMVFLFNFPYFMGTFSDRDQLLSTYLTSMWSNFIATGLPQRSDDLTSQLPQWTPLKVDQPIGYYNISLTPSMVYTPFRRKETNLWLQVLPEVIRRRTSLHTLSDDDTCTADRQCGGK